MKKTILVVTLFTSACLAVALAKADVAFAQSNVAAAQAAPPSAQQMDARFNSWLGCWRLKDDLAGTGARMCITADRSGVRLQTIIGTQRGLDEFVIPDGVARPIADSECKGTERRMVAGRLACSAHRREVQQRNGARHQGRGVLRRARPGSTCSTRAIGHTGVRVQRYRRAINQNLADGSKAPQPSGAASATPTARDATWSIEDVIEASGKLPAEALQAALADVRHGFNMNKTTLVKLDEAGVPDGVIDLMIALTFPKRFVVEHAGGSAPIGVSTGMGWYDPFIWPMYMGAYGN